MVLGLSSASATDTGLRMRAVTRTGALASGMLALLLGMGGGQAAGATSTPVVQAPHRFTTATDGNNTAGGQRINDPSTTAPRYQRNTLGLTYGSAADAARPDLEPDLVWVVTLQGGSGYVYNTELSPPPPAVGAPAPGLRVLTAYTSDGVASVGTFGVGGGSVVADAIG